MRVLTLHWTRAWSRPASARIAGVPGLLLALAVLGSCSVPPLLADPPEFVSIAPDGADPGGPEEPGADAYAQHRLSFGTVRIPVAAELAAVVRRCDDPPQPLADDPEVAIENGQGPVLTVEIAGQCHDNVILGERTLVLLEVPVGHQSISVSAGDPCISSWRRRVKIDPGAELDAAARRGDDGIQPTCCDVRVPLPDGWGERLDPDIPRMAPPSPGELAPRPLTPAAIPISVWVDNVPHPDLQVEGDELIIQRVLGSPGDRHRSVHVQLDDRCAEEWIETLVLAPGEEITASSSVATSCGDLQVHVPQGAWPATPLEVLADGQSLPEDQWSMVATDGGSVLEIRDLREADGELTLAVQTRDRCLETLTVPGTRVRPGRTAAVHTRGFESRCGDLDIRVAGHCAQHVLPVVYLDDEVVLDARTAMGAGHLGVGTGIPECFSTRWDDHEGAEICLERATPIAGLEIHLRHIPTGEYEVLLEIPQWDYKSLHGDTRVSNSDTTVLDLSLDGGPFLWQRTVEDVRHLPGVTRPRPVPGAARGRLTLGECKDGIQFRPDGAPSTRALRFDWSVVEGWEGGPDQDYLFAWVDAVSTGSLPNHVFAFDGDNPFHDSFTACKLCSCVLNPLPATREVRTPDHGAFLSQMNTTTPSIRR